MSASSNPKRIFMIDGHALVYRAYYAFINRPVYSSKGVDTSAIYGFCKSLFELLLKEQPTHLFVAFDPGGKNFRHDMYPQYKANRPPTPQIIKDSLPVIQEILKACGIPIVIKQAVEADDVIGTLSKRAEEDGFDVYMVTPDKDYGQLVSPHVMMYKPHFQGEGWDVIGVNDICRRYEIHEPKQVIDILAIWGDTSDNVPGVRGIGEVGAKKLVGQFGTVENILDNLNMLTVKMQERFTEGREQLMLSKDLVTIRTNLELPWDPDTCKVQCPSLANLKELMNEYEFHSLIRLLPRLEELFCCNSSCTTPVYTEEMPVFASIQHFTALKDTSEAEALLPSAHKSNAVGMSFHYTSNTIIMMVDGGLYSGTPAVCKPLLEDASTVKCGFNLKDVILSLLKQDIFIKGVLWDAALMHYLLNPERSHAPEALAFQYLNYMTPQIESKERSLFDAEAPSLEETQIGLLRPLFEEARIALRLFPVLKKSLEQEGLDKLYLQIEMPLMEVLARMEFEGIRVDLDLLKQYGTQLRTEAEDIERQIRELAEEPALNISSPKQLGVVLYDKLQIDSSRKGKKAYSTDEETLTGFADKHPIVPLILEYRSLKKLLSTYIDPFPSWVNPQTGRVHTTYNQTVTATGRLSSQKPNLQNIPIREERGRELRKAFVARNSDYVLFSADYSQIELRLMAHASGDEHLITAFNAGEDIHAATASKIYKCALSEVTHEQRSRAKTANFGILYGISAFGLATRLRIPRGEAKQLIDDYFANYPKVKGYLDSVIEQARSQGYVETLFHRKRYAPDIHSANAVVRALAERNAINAPIQGTAADIIKIAMVRIQEEIKRRNLRSRMLLQVHDELVFDVFIPEKEQIQQLVIDQMEHAASLSVPLSVGAAFGNNWLEAH